MGSESNSGTTATGDSGGRSATYRAPTRAAGLFAGIGGFELGFSKAGLESQLLCENDPAAKAVLGERFPEIPIENDIRSLEALPSGIDLIAAGFPCQDLSSVGEKEGIEGENSSLIGEVFRLLEDKDTEWVVLENVPFMLQLDTGAAMKAITDELSTMGYRWAYRVVDTSAFGLPQRRRRVFLVASLTNDPRDVLLSDDYPDWNRPEPTMDRPLGFYWTEGRYSVGLSGNGVPPLKGGSGVGIPSPPAILMPDGVAGKPDIRDAERLQGFEADWTQPAQEETRRSSRWRLVGNAVSVDVAEWLGERLLEPGSYECEGDEPFDPSDGWPEAGWSLNGTKYESDASYFPANKPRRGLDEFLEYPLEPLSVRATTGFLKRARQGGLNTPDGFLEKLEQHARRLAEDSA